jgi:hypothetical protein
MTAASVHGALALVVEVEALGVVSPHAAMARMVKTIAAGRTLKRDLKGAHPTPKLVAIDGG